MTETEKLIREAVLGHLNLLEQLIHQDKAQLGNGEPWNRKKEILEAWLADHA